MRIARGYGASFDPSRESSPRRCAPCAALAAADTDGDGRAELAVNTPAKAIGSEREARRVVLLHGGAKNLLDPTGTARAVFFHHDAHLAPGSAEAGDAFGTEVRPRDLNRDGAPELLIRSPGENEASGRGAAVNRAFPRESANAPDADRTAGFGRPDRAAALRDLHLACLGQPLSRATGRFHQGTPTVVVALVHRACGFRGADGGGGAPALQEVADRLLQAPVGSLLAAGHLARMTSATDLRTGR
ncbi:integrin-like protein [Streptomyces albus]|uniref:Integrin-like protein n=1 Tax=Streptomyces albus (strain ATCC 21838 / DSM 41398 / FERM P-419 / JCM 4703 / NBRC 107858) TaxID=1081613 RepID=A0A0B5EQE0_STRA4|nr:integrin-like protein [Streptomyces albus]AOU75830.1 integrin-like protein [Streptomyces albus]AYN31636.1 integrin-like protein [Streptomyces albus]